MIIDVLPLQLDAWTLWRADDAYFVTGLVQGSAIRTSALISRERRHVKTRNTRYALDTPAAAYVEWCAALGIVLDDETPLLLATAMPWPGEAREAQVAGSASTA